MGSNGLFCGNIWVGVVVKNNILYVSGIFLNRFRFFPENRKKKDFFYGRETTPVRTFFVLGMERGKKNRKRIGTFDPVDK